MLRTAKCILALLVLPVFAAAQPLTVNDAVSIALEHNPTVRNAKLEVEKGETRIAAARTRRLPSLTFETLGSEALSRLTFQFEEGAFGTFPETGPIPSKDTRIEVGRTFSTFAIARATQPITQLHRIHLGIRMSETANAVDREQERAARQAITREVKAAYFALLRAESAAQAASESVTVHEEVVREIGVRISQKASLEADRLEGEARLASARVVALQAQNAVLSARQQLNYLLGRDLDTPVEIEQVTPASLEPEAQATSVDARPDVREAELRLQQAQLDLRIKASERIPDVALTVAHSTPINVDNLPSNITAAGVLVSYEPFTWGRRKAELTEKRHAIEQAQNAVRDQRAKAALEIAVQQRQIDEAAARALAQRIETEAARERLRVVKVRFQQQAARPDEMLAAAASVTDASAREQEAMSAWWTARADYEKAIGQE